MLTSTRKNNFGVLRLFFAILVIIGHSPEIIDGDRSREFLTIIFGTLSFGELAVDAFFIISGYLIAASYVNSRGALFYLSKRISRIVPGYFVCFWLCVVFVGPLAGGVHPLDFGVLKSNLIQLALMRTPVVPDAFSTLPYPSLNGSMWTIAYEFRCYIMVMMLGLAGALSLRGRYIVLALTAFLLLLHASRVLADIAFPGQALFGSPMLTVRLTSVFLCGSCFYLFRDKIVYSSYGAAISALLLCVGMFFQNSSEFAVGIFGGYLIFWFAFAVRPFRLSAKADTFDISYGMYLYAWPVQSGLVALAGLRDPWLVTLFAFAITIVPASLSWMFIEKPFLRKVRSGPTPEPSGSPAN